MELSTNAVSSTNEISAFTTPSPVVEKTAGFCPSWDVKTTDVIAAMQIDGVKKVVVNDIKGLGLRFDCMDIGLYGFKGGSSMTALESKLTNPEYIYYLLHGFEKAKNSKLTALGLGAFFQSSVVSFQRAMKNLPKLEKLELRCGRQLSTSRYMGEVFNAIQGSSLKIVTVENACIVGGASDALYELFKKNKSLESLTLKECKVPFKSLPDLMNSLSKHPSLRALALRGNKSPMKLEVAHCLAKGLIKIAKTKPCSLVQVDLSDNKLDDNFVNTMINILTKAWLEDWPIKIILSGNPITKKVQAEFAENPKLIF